MTDAAKASKLAGAWLGTTQVTETPFGGLLSSLGRKKNKVRVFGDTTMSTNFRHRDRQGSLDEGDSEKVKGLPACPITHVT